MKLVTAEHRGVVKAGYIDGEDVVICVEGPEAANAVLQLVKSGSVAEWQDKAASGEKLRLEDVKLLTPIPNLLRDLICVGKNYHAHAAEFFSSGFDSSMTEKVPSAPVIFNKSMTSLIGPGDDINASLDPTNSVDYEGELGVVIGKTARRVPKSQAYDYVFGYVIVNDVTGRELQKKHNQWTVGKGLDTFCTMGPWIATADEIEDVEAMVLTTHVNGAERQKAEVKDLIFDIPTLIETITATGTRLAGDIIATGTPVGVGIGLKPPQYLTKGDHVSVSITGLGTLENPII